jgi:hypothetical protein
MPAAFSLFSSVGTGLIWSQGAVGQPRVQPSGNVVVGDGDPVHPGLQTFDQNGALIWRSLGEMPGTLVPGVDAQTALDVGADGNVYVGTLTFRHRSSPYLLKRGRHASVAVPG